MSGETAFDGLNEANRLVRIGEMARARDILEILDERYPDVAEIAFAFGSILSEQGDHDSALACFGRAGRLKPENAEIRFRVGTSLYHLDRCEESIQAFEEVVSRRPGEGRFACALIRAVVASGDIERAVTRHAALREALHEIEYLPALACALLPEVPNSAEELARARAAYDAAVQQLGSMTGSVPLDRLLRLPTQFFAAYQGADNLRAQAGIANFYARLCPGLSEVRAKTEPAQSRIRIGFVSAHLYNHTIGKLTRGFIARLDRSRFDVFVFSTRDAADEIGRFIAERADTFAVLPDTMAAARDRIAQAELDVLIYPDIGIDPFTYFLAFSRLAQVQVAMWGHPVTSGLSSIDYFLSADDLECATAEAAQALYRERLIRLSVSPVYLYRPHRAGETVPSEFRFEATATIYACLQQPMKFHPGFDHVFVEILRRDPSGRLVLIDFEPRLTGRLLGRLARVGPDVADRIEVLPRLSQAAFFALIEAAHVVLDTSHFSGGVTTAETLALGTAVVTWPHPTLMAGRVSYAYLRQMGIEACIATDPDDYIEKALRIGRDKEHRTGIEQLIVERRGLLLERAEAVRALEGFLETAALSRR